MTGSYNKGITTISCPEYMVLKKSDATDKQIGEMLEKLVKNPLGEPKAVYLSQSIPDLTKKFGRLLLGGILPGLSSRMPGIDDRYQYAYPTINGIPFNHFTFQYFKPYAIYFTPRSDVEAITYFKKDFKKSYSENSMVQSPQGYYRYPDCSIKAESSLIGPCPLTLITNGCNKSNGCCIPGQENECPKTVPLSIEIKNNGTGVYLLRNEQRFWEQAYFQGNQEIAFLKDEPYDFNDKASRIKIKNWMPEIDETNGKVINKRKTNYLAILHEDEQFKGNLRMFFEDFEFPRGPNLTVNVFGNIKQQKDYIADINENQGINDKTDDFGKSKNPSSIQVFKMPNTKEEWEKWQKGADGKGCVVTLCGETYLGGIEESNPDACQEYEGFQLSPLFLDKDVKVREMKNGKWEKNNKGEYITKTESLNNNIRSLSIKGDCIVVLFENKFEQPGWDGGGKHSEVFTPFSKEFKAEGAYKDLTTDNNVYEHSIGECGCSWYNIFGRAFKKCKNQCASSIAIYPIIP